MTPQQMLNAAYQVQQRWPEAAIDGFHGNNAVNLDVVVDGHVVAEVSCRDGSVYELRTPVIRDMVRWV